MSATQLLVSGTTHGNYRFAMGLPVLDLFPMSVVVSDILSAAVPLVLPC